MFLQTLVQLNILILATPALAGWIALPMTQPGVVRAACIALEIRAVEATTLKRSPAEAQSRAAAVRRVPLMPARFALASIGRPVNQSCGFADMPSVVIASFCPFPYAIRAP